MSRLLAVIFALVVQQAPASVSGVIINAATKAPVADARVLLARADGPVTSSVVTTTDERGRFAARHVPPGTYLLSAEADDALRNTHAAPVVVAPGRQVDGLVIALTPTAVIAGRVLMDYGEPAPKIHVRALGATADVIAEARTNDRGEYRLFGLPPGSYVISAEKYPGPTIDGTTVRTPTPPCPDCRGEGTAMVPLRGILASGGFIDPLALTGQSYPTVYYPGTTDRQQARSVEVWPGAEVYGIDLRLVIR